MENLYTAQETAAVLKLHPETLYLWVKQGRGPKPTRLGRKLMFREIAIKEFLDDREEV